MNIRKNVAAKVAVGALLALTAYARTVRTAQTLAARDCQYPPRHSYCTPSDRGLLTSLDSSAQSVN